MLTSIVYVVFAILLIIFFAGCVIVIRNAKKIEANWVQLRKRMADGKRWYLRDLNSSLQRKIHSLNAKPLHQHSLS